MKAVHVEQHVQMISGFGPPQSLLNTTRLPSAVTGGPRNAQTSSGICPTNVLLFNVMTSKFVRRPADVGIVPLKLLLFNVKTPNAPTAPIFSGNGPVKRLFSSWTNVRLTRFSKPSIVPVKSLSLRSKVARLLNPKISAGIDPFNRLKSRSIKFRLLNPPSSLGMVPVVDPCSKPKNTKSVRRPNSVGIVPARLLSSNSILVTHNVVASHVRPAQVHSLTGARNGSAPSNSGRV
mmetsp:Transcript_20350/g.48384  ORF Transcript_20350/g.48384 Transcript_20350/m.48384 type:complete len:234 (-) Transcript_20350:1366-2067(-)